MSQNVPVIHMDPSLFVRVLFSAVCAFACWALLILDLPHAVPPVAHTLLSKIAGFALIALGTYYFMTTQTFNMRMEFYPDRFVFTGFMRHQEIKVSDIEKVTYKGYDVIAALGNMAFRTLEGTQPFVDTPHLTFVLKSGQTIPVDINPSVEKEAIKYLQGMLKNAGHSPPPQG